MDSSGDETSARLEDARQATLVANDKARRERGANDQYDARWHGVRFGFGPPPNVAAIVRLATAISERHPDGANAVQRLFDEYDSDSANVPADFQQVHRLTVLSAKQEFCRALLEAGKPSPDEAAIASFMAQALTTYSNLDTDDVRQDLHSLRKADVRIAPEEAVADVELSDSQPLAVIVPQAADKRPEELWTFEPGLFKFRGKPYDISEVPGKVLRIFVEHKHRDAFDKRELRPALKDELADDGTLRSHLSILRGVLRKVAADFSLSQDADFDPIPHKSGGWRFSLPR